MILNIFSLSPGVIGFESCIGDTPCMYNKAEIGNESWWASQFKVLFSILIFPRCISLFTLFHSSLHLSCSIGQNACYQSTDTASVGDRSWWVSCKVLRSNLVWFLVVSNCHFLVILEVLVLMLMVLVHISNVGKTRDRSGMILGEFLQQSSSFGLFHCCI